MADDHTKTKEELIEELERLRAVLNENRRLGAHPKNGEFLEYDGSEEWRIMMDMLGDFIFVVNSNGSIIKCNPVATNKLGYSKEELLNMNIFDLYPPDRSSEAEETYSQIIVGEKYLCEIPFRARDGTFIAVETKVTPGKLRVSDVIFSISRDVSAGKAVEYELRVAFEKMKTILNSVSAYIWSGIIDSSGRVTYVYQSPAVENITGRFHGYFYQGLDQWFGIVHEDDRERVRGLYRKLMSGESTREEDGYKIYQDTGEIRWVRDSVLARKFGDSQIRLDGVITDITERLQAVHALEQSESRLRLILSSMADMVFAFDTETRFTFYHTPDMGDLYIEPDKFTSEKHSDIMPPEIDELFRAAFNKIKDGGEMEFEYRLDVGGKRKWFSTKLSPIIKDGKFNGAVAVVRDISEHKTLEEALKDSERRYRELFNNIHDGYTWIDMNGRMIDFNQPFENLLGYEREELFLLTIWDITPAKWHKQEKKIIEEQVLQRGYSDIYRKEYIRKDGTSLPVEVQRCLIRDHKENPEGMWVIVRKLTPRSA
ncbi:MAG: hypothetical protein A2176_12350 [Spirochaetes bacterium RBG_13_51_14]|nr:MAG: hypothetical protein A2176_12350 [Spirochaetes bacterium RBG_13_51_14]